MSTAVIEVVRKFAKIAFVPAIVLAGLTIAAPAAKAFDFSTYAAVAFSQSTGAYGYSWNQPNQCCAERAALSVCGADDAEIVGWVKGGFIALAIGDDNSYGGGWQYGATASSDEAAQRATSKCHEF